MPRNKRRSIAKKCFFYLRLFFRKYPNFHFVIKWSLISILISILIGSASAGFLYSLDWVTDFRENHWWIIIFLPIGGFLIGILYYYYGKDVEAGNNILIDYIHEPRRIIPLRMAPFIYIGTIVTHFLGGSAGREGTALQMAGSIVYPFTKLFGLAYLEKRILIIAAVAGGFGSVFGTPLAGAIFALEFFLIGNILFNALFPAFLTAILSDVVTKVWWKAPHTHYSIDFIPEISFLNFFYIIFAGIIFGLCALVFIKLMHNCVKVFKSKITFPPIRPLIGGIIIVFTIVAIGTTKYIGLGIPTILLSFEQILTPYDFAIKMILTIITLSSGFKGGEVTPLFFIGATLGNALSLWIPLPTGLLAGMGFVAVFAGASNTPIACTIMAIELFGVNCGVYAALACSVSYLFSGHNSIYQRQVIGEAKFSQFSNHKGKRFHEL